MMTSSVTNAIFLHKNDRFYTANIIFRRENPHIPNAPTKATTLVSQFNNRKTSPAHELPKWGYLGIMTSCNEHNGLACVPRPVPGVGRGATVVQFGKCIGWNF